MERRTRPLTWLAAALVVSVGLMVVLGAWIMTMIGGYYGMMGGSWTWGLLMMVVPGIVLIIVLLAALGGFDQLPARSREPSASPAPLAILDERYARGDLSREDYLRTRSDLETGQAHS